MEKVFHPDCSCGQPVMYEIEQLPVLEDGVLIAMQQGHVWFHTRCEDCDHKAHLAQLPITEDEDELPF